MSYPQPPAYPPAPGSPPGDPGKVRLRGATLRLIGWIMLGLGIALVVAGGVVLGGQGLSKVNDFARVPVAQGGSVHLDSGSYLAYYEASDVTSGINSVPLPLITLTGPSGQRIELDTLYGGNPRSGGTITHRLTYDYNGHKGVAIYQFHLSESGEYQVAISEAGAAAAGSQIAFGSSIAKALVAGVVMLVGGVLIGAAAVVLLIIGFVKRSNHKGELRQAQAWGGLAPAYGGQPPYAGYGGPSGYPPPAPYGYQPPQPPPQQPPQQPNFGDPTAPPRDDSA